MKKLCLGIFLVTALVILSLSVYAESEKRKIADSVLRFHVVAESNEEKDQLLKLKVRDRILAETEALFKDVKNKKEALLIAKKNKDLIKEAAVNELEKAGCNLPVTVSVEKERFPMKEYENIRLPGGMYDSVKVNIGNAKGENWWCIMYPALCFSGSVLGKACNEAEKILKEELGEERFSLVTDTTDTKIRIKFKILELF